MSYLCCISVTVLVCLYVYSYLCPCFLAFNGIVGIFYKGCVNGHRTVPVKHKIFYFFLETTFAFFFFFFNLCPFFSFVVLFDIFFFDFF